MANATAHRPPAPRISIATLLRRAADDITAIEAYDGPLLDLLDDEPITGDLYIQLDQDRQLELITNFSHDHLIDIYRCMQPFMLNAGTRGPKPKSSWMDQLICYLAWGKLAEQIDVLAKVLGIKPNRLEDNIVRIRSVLNAALKARWWDPRARPKIAADSPFPHVALLVDGHTSTVHRPKCPF